MKPFFKKAKPVWLPNLQRNITLGFYTLVKTGGTPLDLSVATAGFYRVFLDGKFVQSGPARCAHGFYRVDQFSLDIEEGEHHIAIETVQYGLNSFSSLRQPAFFQAELHSGGKILAATGHGGFDVYRLTERIRKMQRFSYQRPMGESYCLYDGVYGWRMGNPGENAIKSNTVVVESKKLIPRNLPMNFFPVTGADICLSRGNCVFDAKPEQLRKDRSLTQIGESEKYELDGWKESELELHLSDEVQYIANTEMVSDHHPYTGETYLEAGQFEILALSCEKTGYMTVNIDCRAAGTVYLMVDETLRPNGDVDPLSMECLNVIRLDCKVGNFCFQSMEPFGFRYVKLVCKSGSFCLRNFRIIELICPLPVRSYSGTSPYLKAVFDAACETFKQNSTDIFMDCPTRERAGWLCDSYFTARAERVLTGGNAIEHNFLENFLLPEHFVGLPEGMLPMCYPADPLCGEYIPNWAMWFVLELEDYLLRTGDIAFVKRFEDRVHRLFNWFKQYENEDGLLEKLPGWVFVEWSHANDLVQDINFPTNMLYAAMSEAAGKLFEKPDLIQKAEKLRDTIRQRSYDGKFFRDNEVEKDGKMVSSGEITETCQYYAFFTKTATPKTHKELWKIMCDEFGPQRRKTGAWKEIAYSNAFIGNYLRLELLAQEKMWAKLLDESVGYFYNMAKKTGTLWENDTDHASCNHGFASYIAVLILAAETGE